MHAKVTPMAVNNNNGEDKLETTGMVIMPRPTALEN